MATKLIRLDDDTLVEVEVPPDQAQQISGRLADKVNATLDKAVPVLIRACVPVAAAWQQVSENVHVEQAEIAMGLSFEGEGNLYITRSKATANLTIKLVLRSRDRPANPT